MIYIVYQKHSPTLARCSFNKRFDSFGKQHQHTFRCAYSTFLVSSFLLNLFAFK